MTAINASTTAKTLSQLAAEVNDSSIPVIIVNDDGRNAVLISEDDWNSIQETMYLYSIPGLLEDIKEARQESLSECKTYDPDEEW